MKRDNIKTKQNEMREDDIMDEVITPAADRKRLDFSKLSFGNKKTTYEESLSDVIPFSWSEEVLNGEKKVIISKTTE